MKVDWPTAPIYLTTHFKSMRLGIGKSDCQKKQLEKFLFPSTPSLFIKHFCEPILFHQPLKMETKL